MNQPLLQMDLRLVGSAVVVLGAAVIAIWVIGRRMRAHLGLTGNSKSAPMPDLRLPDASPPVARELQARGLVTSAQLATMTEAERTLLFSTMAGAVGRAPVPQVVPPSARGAVRAQELPPLHCPLCSFRIERFTSTPPITGQCETCGTRVVVRRDGARLLLTVMPSSPGDGRV
ncbi:MAG: hypothetical protein H3C62_02260 [Gemmatimonadaceae bacterium]|nr:hypothetical protein [Gemmatimonadaceae bacterium]